MSHPFPQEKPKTSFNHTQKLRLYSASKSLRLSSSTGQTHALRMPSQNHIQNPIETRVNFILLRDFLVLMLDKNLHREANVICLRHVYANVIGTFFH